MAGMGSFTPRRACLYSEIRSYRQLVIYQNCWAMDAVVEMMTESAIKEMSVAVVSIGIEGKCLLARRKGKRTTPALAVVEMHEKQHYDDR